MESLVRWGFAEAQLCRTPEIGAWQWLRAWSHWIPIVLFLGLWQPFLNFLFSFLGGLVQLIGSQCLIRIGNREKNGGITHCLVYDLVNRKSPTPSKNRATMWSEKSQSLSRDSNLARSERKPFLYHLRYYHGPIQEHWNFWPKGEMMQVVYHFHWNDCSANFES